MNKLMLVLVALALLSGCATNGQFDGKKTAWLVGTLVVTGVVLSQSDGSGGTGYYDPNCPITYPDPNSPGHFVCR
jgi:hypothetical protein